MEEVLLLLLFLWLLFPPTNCKDNVVMCSMTEPFQLPHKYYQSGELLIGAITTQFGCISDELSFSEHPNTQFIDELM